MSIPIQRNALSALSNLRYVLLDWVKVGLFVPLITTTLRWHNTRKAAGGTVDEREA